MALPNIFDKAVTERIIGRIQPLQADSKALWGKMSPAQMLAHCNVAYEMAFENKHPKPNFFMGFILKNFIKEVVVGEKPYKKSSQTAPAFVVKSDKDFEAEKNRLIAYLYKCLEVGEDAFEQKESLSFGKLSKKEWSNMFYKHLDHHLSQFGL